MTPEEFIKEYTMGCSNDITPIGDYDHTYQEWLTPEQALRAVELAREEIKSEIERLIKSYSPIQSSEGKYRIEAYKEVLDIINSNCLEISRHGNSHIGENRELERIISKACKWLEDYLLDYWSQINANNTESFIDNFKKAMEE